MAQPVLSVSIFPPPETLDSLVVPLGSSAGVGTIAWMGRDDGRCSLIGSAWTEATGQKLEDALGFGWLDAIHPEDRDTPARLLDEARSTGQRAHQSYRILTASGDYRTVQHELEAVPSSANRVGDDFFGSIQISSLPQPRYSQGDSLGEILARLLSAVPAAIYATDVNGVITLYNEAAATLWGRRPVVGKELWCGSWKIFTPAGEPVALDECPMAVALKNGRVVRGEEIVVERPDGSRVNVLPHPNPLFSGTGEIIGAVNLLLDITERKRAEATMAEQSEMLQDFVDNASVGLHWVGPDGSIIWANRAELDLLGYTEEEYIGRHISEFHADSDAIADILCRLSRDETLDSYEAPLRAKDGTIKHVLISSNVFWKDGKFHHTRCFTRDITEIKAAHEAIRQANLDLEERVRERTAELQAAYREMEGFTYSVSHDLRTPLRSINSTSRMLLEDHAPKLDAEIQRLLIRQADSAKRLADLIDDLLKLSRLSRQEIRRETVDMTALVVEIAEEHRSVSGKDFDLEIQPGLKAAVDRQLMRLVLDNFFSNSIKFAASDRRLSIRVSSMSTDSGEALCFTDNGIGFEQKYADKAFLPFERLVRDDEYPGTGIGLANVKRIVERHGGVVWVESRPDSGTTFYFTVEPKKTRP